MTMRVINRSMVKPAEPTWNGILPLTELDQISVITHTTQIYFYDKPQQQDCWLNPTTNKIFDTLRESLSRVLVPFYPLAGRLRWIGGDRMTLECTPMGAELVEVESSMKIADFGDFHSRTETFRDLLVEVDSHMRPLQDLPLLAVQITRFACGGLSVGISMSHVIVDGRCSFHFVDEWARLARGEPLQVAPFLDRRMLQAEEQVHVGGFYDSVENRDYFRNLTSEENRVTPTFVLLTKDEIERLKEVANDGLNNESRQRRPYSRFEVIAAHVWRCVCKARELKNDDSTSFNAFVDSRPRMDPPLPSNYFGNAVVETHISSNAGELISKPLSYACSKIREATTKVTCAYVVEFIKHLKNQQNLTKYQYIEDRGKVEGSSCGDHNVSCTSWLNLAACGADFGWGSEVYMGPCIVYDCDGYFVIIPCNKNDGSVLLGAFLKPKQKFREYMNILF